MSSDLFNAVIRGKAKPFLQELSSDFVVAVMDHDTNNMVVHVHGDLDLCDKLAQAVKLRIAELKNDGFRSIDSGGDS